MCSSPATVRFSQVWLFSSLDWPWFYFWVIIETHFLINNLSRAGIGNVAWFLSAELVPQRYRSMTQAISYALNTIAVVIVTFTTLPLFQLIDVYSFIILFSIPSILSIIYLVLYLPETKGREIHDIVDILRGKIDDSLEMKKQDLQ